MQQYQVLTTGYPTSSPIIQLDKRNFELISPALSLSLPSMSKQEVIIRVDTSDRIKVSQESGLNMQFEFVGRPIWPALPEMKVKRHTK